MHLSGHNSYSGCRFCYLRGTLSSNNHVYYPLQSNIITTTSQLPPLRTHDETLNIINQLDNLGENYG